MHKCIEMTKLALLPPFNVYDWLERRATDAESWRRGWDDMLLVSNHEEIDKALLARNDPLIDLGLAKYTVSYDVARELFARLSHADPSQQQHNFTLRLATLSNRCLMPFTLSVFGAGLFKNANACIQWLNVCDDSEISSFFTHPKLDNHFLRDFLEGEQPWNSIQEDKRMLAILKLAESDLHESCQLRRRRLRRLTGRRQMG